MTSFGRALFSDVTVNEEMWKLSGDGSTRFFPKILCSPLSRVRRKITRK